MLKKSAIKRTLGESAATAAPRKGLVKRAPVGAGAAPRKGLVKRTPAAAESSPQRGIRRDFGYKRRDKNLTNARNSNVKDPWTPSDVELYKPKEGENRIRILPPTWDNPKHHGFEVQIHYSVGDNRQYICPNHFRGDDCPICQEATAAYQEGDSKYGQACLPSSAWLVWILDRLDAKNPNKPKLWKCPRGTDEELMILAKDRDTGEYIEIDHPDQGYDVCFDGVKKSAPINNQKVTFVEVKGLQILLNKPNAISDEVLVYLSENPIPSKLVIYDYQHIMAVFSGGKDNETETEKTETEDQSGEEKTTYTVAELNVMRLGELEDICLTMVGLDEATVRATTKEDLIRAICDFLELDLVEQPKVSIFKKKLAGLRKR